MAHKVKAGSFADKRRGSRHERGYGTAWDKVRTIIQSRAAGLCEPCMPLGIVHEGHHCDHKINKETWKRLHGSLDGVDDPSNLQWINRDCHRIKTQAEAAAARGIVPATDTTTATVGKSSGPAAPVRGAPGAGGQQAGGGEKSGASSSRTEPQGKFLRAGNGEGGGTFPAGEVG